MELVIVIILLLITLIVLTLAVFLIATIAELVKINRGLGGVLNGVAEIATKTAPVNGVLDAINGTLVAGRDLLEGLALKKAGPDAAGLVESCFPGEGQRFLQRIGRSGTVVPIGEDYPRGAAILNSLLGVEPAPAPPVAATQAAAPAPAPAAAGSSSGRISLRKRGFPSGGAPMGGGGMSMRPRTRAQDEPAPPPDGAPMGGGRISVKGSRPWE